MGVALYFTLRFTSPILKLSQIVRRITQQRDYALRAELKGDDEVGMLVGGFNGMLDEVQAGQKDLAERVSLDLKTRLRTHICFELDETGKILLARLHLVEHPVESADQHAHFIVSLQLCTQRVVALLGDATDDLRQLRMGDVKRSVKYSATPISPTKNATDTHRIRACWARRFTLEAACHFWASLDRRTTIASILSVEPGPVPDLAVGRLVIAAVD